MEKKIEDYYKKKREASFRTYFSFILFEFIVNNEEEDFFKLTGAEFISYSLKSNTKDQYIHEYWQLPTNKYVSEVPYKGDIKKIMDQMDAWGVKREKEKEESEEEEVKANGKRQEKISEFRKAYEGRFREKFQDEEFKKLYNTKKCKYCDISENEIMQLADKGEINKKSLRGWTLEIDRDNPNDEYTYKNCVRCCYWCNNAKTDEFTGDEFIKIGKAMRGIWDDRLKKIKDDESK